MKQKEAIQILVVEDDPLVGDDIIRLLGELGYSNCNRALDGDEAIEFACKEHPDLIFMDIVMPNLNGTTACQMIQKDCPTPVIMLSSYVDQTFVREATEAGASYYITKPPKPDELERAMWIALARNQDLELLRQKNLELEEALKDIKELKGLIPICSHCHKIRTPDDTWEQLELFIESQSKAQFSHGICPTCRHIHYPEI